MTESDSAAFQDERRSRLACLARAGGAELEAAWASLPVKPEVTCLRGPETGLVMLRGRIGGTGGRFNLGEATVSRATVRLDGGEIGHGQVLGTDRHRARLAAVFDALAQSPAGRPVVDRLCAVIASRLERERAQLAAETAATRVNFFTLVRGED